MDQGWTSLLWFLAVLAMVPAALWLLKRNAMVRTAAPSGQMRLVATLPLSAQQRLLTVEVGTGDERRWLVLGVTSQSITTLHTMAPQGDWEAAAQPPLAQLLRRLRAGDRQAP
jgi:flagellar protein FliO/FliZ